MTMVSQEHDLATLDTSFHISRLRTTSWDCYDPRTLARCLRPDLPRLAERLGLLRAEWEGRRLDSDPLAFAHLYHAGADREVVAFLAASFAFGRVASIRTTLGRILALLGPSPAAFLRAWDGRGLPGLPETVHRWVTRRDLLALLRALARTLREEGSLGALFSAGDDGGEDYVEALDRFYAALRARTGIPPGSFSRGLGFLLPAPSGGSACKRAHLFLRWTVRAEGHDLGLWRGGRFTPARLLLPMDTHVHRISTYLELTGRKTADLKAAREATGWLKRIAPEDPVAYDWALSRLGILAECVRARTRSHCERCAVRPVCRVALSPRPDFAAAPLRLDA